jgi:O-antigen/teichoic acid export membrane protein
VNPSVERHFRTDHLKDNLGKRAVRGGMVTISAQAIKFLALFAATTIFGRLLTPDDYGLIGMVAVVTGFVSMFKDLGLSAATIQREHISAREISTLFWINVGISLTATVFTILIAPGVAWFYAEPRLMLITIAFTPAFLFGGLTVQHEALLRRQMRFIALAALEISSLVIGLVVGIWMALRGAGYWSLVANQLVLSFVYVCGIWAVCGWIPGMPVRNSGVRSMLAFGGNFTGFSIVNYFGSNLDNLLVGKTWGAQQLGFYAKAYQLLLLPIDQINTPISAVAVPSLSRLADETERYKRAYSRILEKLTLVTMPLAAFMIVSSDWLVRLVLGPQWDATARIFSILGFAAFLLPVLNSTGWLFITQNRTREMFRWGLVEIGMRVLSIVAGLPWGAKGVALGIVIRMFIEAPILFWFVGRKGPVSARDLYSGMASSSLAFLASLIALLTLRTFFHVTSPIIGILLAMGMTTGITVLMLLALPRGRATLLDLKHSLTLLLRRRTA